MEGDFEVPFEDDHLPASSSQNLLFPHEAVSSRKTETTSVLPRCGFTQMWKKDSWPSYLFFFFFLVDDVNFIRLSTCVKLSIWNPLIKIIFQSPL